MGKLSRTIHPSVRNWFDYICIHEKTSFLRECWIKTEVLYQYYSDTEGSTLKVEFPTFKISSKLLSELEYHIFYTSKRSYQKQRVDFILLFDPKSSFNKGRDDTYPYVYNDIVSSTDNPTIPILLPHSPQLLLGDQLLDNHTNEESCANTSNCTSNIPEKHYTRSCKRIKLNEVRQQISPLISIRR